MKKQARGLIVVTRIDDVLTVIGQRRGLYKLEGGKLVRESYAGATQVTFHGGMEEVDGGDTHNCLRREGREEVGFVFTENALLSNAGERSLTQVGLKDTDSKAVITMAVFLPGSWSVIEQIRWHTLSGGLQLITPQTHMTILTKDMRDSGVTDLKVVAMHADEWEGIVKTFAEFQDWH